jgi:RNA polymerase sigma factor (sigma-70 family)
MEAKQLSNRSLIEKLVDAGAGDPLWTEFVARFEGRLQLVVYRSFQTEMKRSPGLDVGAPFEAAEDLTQEVFLKLLEGERRALSRFRGRSEHSIYTYLNAIAVNLVRDHFKRLRALKTPRAAASLSNVVSPEEGGGGLSYEQAIVAEGPGPERFVASSELRERIRATLAAISSRETTSERDQLVFQLYFIEGLTVGEIARDAAIGLSESGVEKCIRRIREALRESLSHAD